MKHWLLFITISLLVSLGFAQTCVANVTPVGIELSVARVDVTQDNHASYFSNSRINFSYSNHPVLVSDVNAEHQFNATLRDHINQASIVSVNYASSIGFRNPVQTDPIYFASFEFQATNYQLQRAFQQSIMLDNLTNYLNHFDANQKSTNHRLSGWKDGNCLYTACITYH